MTDVEMLVERFSRNRILRKVIVSLVVGGFVYGVTELTGQEEVWQLTMSIFLGGATLVVQLLMTFENRLVMLETANNRHMSTIESMVQSGFTKIDEVTKLFGLVEASALRAEAIGRLVQQAPPLVLRFAQDETGRFSDFLRDISESGNFLYDGEDRDWLLTLARNAEKTIDATSLTTVDAGGAGYVNGGFWTSDLGQTYLEVQREAIKNRVKIRRLFVLVNGSGANDMDDLTRVCRLQQKMGIDVRLLDFGDVPALGREPLLDFIIFDKTISYETTPAQMGVPGPPTISSTRLELRPDVVQSRFRRFEHLWENGREVE
jgi:hypothetical protein